MFSRQLLLLLSISFIGLMPFGCGEPSDPPAKDGTNAPAKDTGKDAGKDTGKTAAKAKSDTPPTPSTNLQRDLDKLQAAWRASDTQAFVAMIPKPFIPGGDAAAMAEQLASNKDVLAILKSTQFEKPGPIVTTADGQAAIIPMTAEIHQNGKLTGHMKSGMLAVSVDEGKTWQFNDIGGEQTRATLLEWKPELHRKIADQFPTFSVEPLKPGN